MSANEFCYRGADYKKVAYCPFCGKPIWGEGWDKTTRVYYFSHVTSSDCHNEISLKIEIPKEAQ